MRYEIGSKDTDYEKVYIYSELNGLYWRERGMGYTAKIEEAGKFSRFYAEEVLDFVNDEKKLKIIEIDDKV